MHLTPLRAVLTLFLSLQSVDAMAPLMCPGGAPLGRFALEVAPRNSGAALDISAVNQLEAGDTISYCPVDIMAAAKKKVRIALLLVPSDGSKIARLRSEARGGTGIVDRAVPDPARQPGLGPGGSQ